MVQLLPCLILIVLANPSYSLTQNLQSSHSVNPPLLLLKVDLSVLSELKSLELIS